MQQTSTVRIDKESDKILHEIAEHERVPMTKIIHEALVSYRKKYFLKKCSEAYSALKSNPKKLKSELGERDYWDNAIDDGLERDE
ncbi:MAG: CopG family transcriptional regulator [Pseudomonadota bacterium]